MSSGLAGRKRLVIRHISLIAVAAVSIVLDLGQAVGQRPHAGAVDQRGGLGLPAPSLSELSTQPVPNMAANSTTPRMVLPAESLGGDDLLEIMVPYCPELSRTFRISSDGTLTLPLLHRSIPAAGITPAGLATRIQEALISEKVMAEPIVNVSVLEYRSRPVSVIGAVLHPLTFQATGETTLLDAIAMAGGFAPAVGPNILVTTRDVTSHSIVERSVQTIPVRGLVRQTDPAYNIRLHGGEEIRIPEAGKVFVAGNVLRPGMYIMQGDEETTVLKALALSEGLQPYSASNAYIYRRSSTGGERQEIKVPLSRIVARKQPDVALMADDIFYIPVNGGKRMTARVLTQIAGFGQTTAAGVLVYR